MACYMADQTWRLLIDSRARQLWGISSCVIIGWYLSDFTQMNSIALVQGVEVED
jgi:hypothetical protein